MCDCPTRLCLLCLYECPGEAKICNLQVVEMQGLAKWTSAARTHTQQCMQQPGLSVQIALTLTVKPRASFVELHNKILLPAWWQGWRLPGSCWCMGQHVALTSNRQHAAGAWHHLSLHGVQR